MAPCRNPSRLILPATKNFPMIPHLRWTPLPAQSLFALQRCPDNLYNRYDEGGYLIWFAPDHRVCRAPFSK